MDLPPWAPDARIFVKIHRQALESSYVRFVCVEEKLFVLVVKKTFIILKMSTLFNGTNSEQPHFGFTAWIQIHILNTDPDPDPATRMKKNPSGFGSAIM